MLVLLPCHSLEDLSLDRPAEEAEQLLSAWSALFHPALIQACDRVPSWDRADYPSPGSERRIIVVPPCSESHLSESWIERAENEKATLIRGVSSREEVLAAALEAVGRQEVEVDPDLVADFFAAGTCYLQVELLTRQLRYMSNLDEVQFAQEAREAAAAAIDGDRETAQGRLRAAFDLLTEAREYFYPVETYLLDYTLVTKSTLGPELRSDLAANPWTNLLISGAVLESAAREEPETLVAIQEALADGRVGLIGGELEEHELPLLASESILALLRTGLGTYEQYLQDRPKIFGRRKFGLTPVLPAILRGLGFVGAVHFTLDDGRFPKPNQSKMRWQGQGSTRIESLVRLPVDAARSEEFLKLPEDLGEIMDLDHAATAVFAHWPGRSCRWYEDLRRMAKYSPALGKFVTIKDYFCDTECVGPATHYAADPYRSPYLRQAIAVKQVDPLSRYVRYYRRAAAVQALSGLTALRDALRGTVEAEPDVLDLARRVAESTSVDAEAGTALDAEISEAVSAAWDDLGRRLPREDGSERTGVLTINPWSFSLPVSEARSDAEEPSNRERRLVPAMGFDWREILPESPGTADDRKTPRKGFLARKRRPAGPIPLAAENVLRNDLLRVEIDPVTGSMKSLHTATTRGNRLSQQVAFRAPGGIYSTMAADEVAVRRCDRSVGEIAVQGRLLYRDGTPLAGFSQVYRIRANVPVVELEIRIDPQRLPEGDPWNNYYASRFAWADATVDVRRSVNSMTVPTDVDLLEAPQFLDLSTEEMSTTLLTGGLPYHRRFGLRSLDSLLIVEGETERNFRLGIAVDDRYPMQAALRFLSPECGREVVTRPIRGGSGWLFHLNCKNVVATHWQAMEEEGRAVGVRVRLMETEGRACKMSLTAFRPVQAARTVDFLGNEAATAEVQDGRVTLDVQAHQWIELEARFA